MPRKLLIVDEAPASASMRSVKDKKKAAPAKKKRVLQIVDDGGEKTGFTLTNVQSMKVIHLSSRAKVVSFLETSIPTFNKRLKNGQPLYGWIIESGRNDDKKPSAAAVATAAAFMKKKGRK